MEIAEVSSEEWAKLLFTLAIKTSCSSAYYTRDKISVAFGDIYGNEVYAKRLCSPFRKTFERRSVDRFRITGPSMCDVCYLYFLRNEPYGRKPEGVKISSVFTRPVTYYLNVFLPNGVWYGFNQCYGGSPTAAM